MLVLQKVVFVIRQNRRLNLFAGTPFYPPISYSGNKKYNRRIARLSEKSFVLFISVPLRGLTYSTLKFMKSIFRDFSRRSLGRFAA